MYNMHTLFYIYIVLPTNTTDTTRIRNNIPSIKV